MMQAQFLVLSIHNRPFEIKMIYPEVLRRLAFQEGFSLSAATLAN
jgi:hypothetical protein